MNCLREKVDLKSRLLRQIERKMSTSQHTTLSTWRHRAGAPDPQDVAFRMWEAHPTNLGEEKQPKVYEICVSCSPISGY